MQITEIKIGGLGGQGVILSGMIIGRAAAIYDDKYATMTQAFGPEARGSACSAQVLISDKAILYPYVANPDVLMVMSQDACNQFAPAMKNRGESVLIYEQDMVAVDDLPCDHVRTYGIPATRIAEEIGRRMVLNIVMVGFFAAVAPLLNVDAVRTSVKASVPRGTESLNLSAFDKGYRYGHELLQQQPNADA